MHLWTHWFQCYTHTRIIHRVKWRHSNLWSQYDLYAVGNTAYCVRFSGGDLSRYSNKIESDGLRKCPYYRCLTLKMMSRITNIFQNLLHNMAGKTAGMDMVWRNYVTVTPCIQTSFVIVQSGCAFSVDPVSVPVSFESAPECQKKSCARPVPNDWSDVRDFHHFEWCYRRIVGQNTTDSALKQLSDHSSDAGRWCRRRRCCWCDYANTAQLMSLTVFAWRLPQSLQYIFEAVRIGVNSWDR